MVIFLFEFKRSHKAMETTLNINNTFGPGTANEHTGQWWFKKFCKGDESLEDEECSDQLRAIIESDPLTPTQEVAKELDINLSMVVQHLKQIGKVKGLISGCLMSWPKIKKTVILMCLLTLYNSEPFLDWIMTYNEVWI